jgi:hypothetical protein
MDRLNFLFSGSYSHQLKSHIRELSSLSKYYIKVQSPILFDSASSYRLSVTNTYNILPILNTD